MPRSSQQPGDPGGQELTPRQQMVLQAIEDCVRSKGYSPSMREIGAAAGLASTSGVAHQVTALVKKGRLSREARRPRTAVPRRPDDSGAGQRDHGEAGEKRFALVPLVGRIAAGGPVLSFEEVEGVIPLPRELTGEGSLLMLRVAGDSMTGAAIADGDLVVIRREPDAENGEIIAAMIEDDVTGETGATIKTLRRRDGHAWLIPHNPAYAPIPADNAAILGKVVAVLRRLR